MHMPATPEGLGERHDGTKPKIAEWTDIHVPLAVAAVTAVTGAGLVAVRHRADPPGRGTGTARGVPRTEPKGAAEDGITVFADRPPGGGP
ncbi:hypothetical protein [Streptomyces sp. NPDC053427]|uniref:hypothetical protein n=1 Tax=Streptomyces sp. NPDC053427 TaxID=3365701 RepID=UPI0037D615CA